MKSILITLIVMFVFGCSSTKPVNKTKVKLDADESKAVAVVLPKDLVYQNELCGLEYKTERRLENQGYYYDVDGIDINATVDQLVIASETGLIVRKDEMLAKTVYTYSVRVEDSKNHCSIWITPALVETQDFRTKSKRTISAPEFLQAEADQLMKTPVVTFEMEAKINRKQTELFKGFYKNFQPVNIADIYYIHEYIDDYDTIHFFVGQDRQNPDAVLRVNIITRLNRSTVKINVHDFRLNLDRDVTQQINELKDELIRIMQYD